MLSWSYEMTGCRSSSTPRTPPEPLCQVVEAARFPGLRAVDAMLVAGSVWPGQALGDAAFDRGAVRPRGGVETGRDQRGVRPCRLPENLLGAVDHRDSRG